MAKRIRNLRVHEVSLVDRPANPGARVLLYKHAPPRADSLAKEARTFEDVMAERDAEEKIDDAVHMMFRSVTALRESVASILADDEAGNKRQLVEQSIDQFRTSVGGQLEQLGKRDLTTADVMAAIEKAEDLTMATKDDLTQRVEELEGQLGDLTKKNGDLEKEKADLEKRAADAEEEAEDLRKKAEGGADPDAEIFKGMTPEARARFEELEKQRKSDREALEKIHEQREVDAAVMKVEKTYSSLPCKPEDFGPIYRKIGKALSEEEMKLIDQVLASHGEFAKLATVEKGQAGSPTSGQSAVEAEVETKAKDLQKQRPDLSLEACKGLVWAGPDGAELTKRWREAHN